MAMHAPESIASLRARKQDVRGEVADLRMELAVRRSDALRLVEDSQPYLSRLEIVALEVGPVALQSVGALRSLLARHARQWDEGPDAA